jgi:uncharacterized protein YukE
MAMSLKVDTDSVDRFSELIKRAGEHLTAGAEHMNNSIKLEETGGEIFELMAGYCHDAIDVGSSALKVDAQTAGSSALGVGLATNYYRSTDQSVAGSFDLSLPPADCPPMSKPPQTGQAAFQDATDPKEHLEKPEPEDFGFKADPLHFLEYLSPGAYLMDGVLEVGKWILGVDPVEWVASKVAGNWEEIAKCAALFKQEAELSEGVAGNIGHGTADLKIVWEGNAADAAVTYFMHLDDNVEGLKEPFMKIHDTLMQGAQGIWQCIESVKGLLSTLFDIFVAAAALITAGGVLIETGVGTLVAWGAALTLIGEAFEVWDTITHTVDICYKAIKGLSGVISAQLSTINGLPQLDVMSGSYNFPAYSNDANSPKAGGMGHTRAE